MPEYRIATTRNFHHSRLRVMCHVIIYRYSEIEAAFLCGSDGRVVHTDAYEFVIRLAFIILPGIIYKPAPYKFISQLVLILFTDFNIEYLHWLN